MKGHSILHRLRWLCCISSFTHFSNFFVISFSWTSVRGVEYSAHAVQKRLFLQRRHHQVPFQRRHHILPVTDGNTDPIRSAAGKRSVAFLTSNALLPLQLNFIQYKLTCSVTVICMEACHRKIKENGTFYLTTQIFFSLQLWVYISEVWLFSRIVIKSELCDIKFLLETSFCTFDICSLHHRSSSASVFRYIWGPELLSVVNISCVCTRPWDRLCSERRWASRWPTLPNTPSAGCGHTSWPSANRTGAWSTVSQVISRTSPALEIQLSPMRAGERNADNHYCMLAGESYLNVFFFWE